MRKDLGSLGEDAAEDKPSSAQQPRPAKKKKATKNNQRDGSDSSEENVEDSFDDASRGKPSLSKKKKRPKMPTKSSNKSKGSGEESMVEIPKELAQAMVGHYKAAITKETRPAQLKQAAEGDTSLQASEVEPPKLKDPPESQRKQSTLTGEVASKSETSEKNWPEMKDSRYAKPWNDGSAIDCNACARAGKLRCATIKMRPPFNTYNWEHEKYGHIHTSGHIDTVAQLTAEEESGKRAKKATSIGAFFKASSNQKSKYSKGSAFGGPPSQTKRTNKDPSEKNAWVSLVNPAR